MLHVSQLNHISIRTFYQIRLTERNKGRRENNENHELHASRHGKKLERRLRVPALSRLAFARTQSCPLVLDGVALAQEQVAHKTYDFLG